MKSFYIILFLFMTMAVSAQNSKLKKFKQLSVPEKCWVIFHPFVATKALKITESARKETEVVRKGKILKGSGNGDQVDAFRHTFWMANLAIGIGWRRAISLGKAHEKGNYKDYQKRKLEDGVIPDKISSDMDYFNNDVGVKIGKMSNVSDIKNIVIDAVKEGRCKIIKIDQSGNFLDVEGSILSNEELKGKWGNEKCLVRSNELY